MNHSAPTALDALEWKLLLAASSPDLGDGGLNRIRILLERPADWDAVFRLADQHGTSSLLYQNLAPLGNAVPSAVLMVLRQKYERNVHKSLFLARELVRILACLDAIGVVAIPYKGAALSEVYYGDMALRQSGDMDLFVRVENLPRIRNAVRDLGYTARVAIPQDAEAHYIASGYEYTFDSPAGNNLLELQWALQPRFYSVEFDMKGLFERAVEVTVAGRRAKTPSPEDLLIVLSVHAAKHGWGRLIWLCDIAQIMKQKSLNWDWIRSQARELGIERILHVTLLLVNSLLGMTIPAEIKRATRADQVAVRFAEQIAVSIAAGVKYEEEKVSYFCLMLRLRERRMDRWRFFSRLAFTPGPGEWAAVRLPRALFPLYQVVRMGRLMARLVRG